MPGIYRCILFGIVFCWASVQRTHGQNATSTSESTCPKSGQRVCLTLQDVENYAELYCDKLSSTTDCDQIAVKTVRKTEMLSSSTCAVTGSKKLLRWYKPGQGIDGRVEVIIAQTKCCIYQVTVNRGLGCQFYFYRLQPTRTTPFLASAAGVGPVKTAMFTVVFSHGLQDRDLNISQCRLYKPPKFENLFDPGGSFLYENSTIYGSNLRPEDSGTYDVRFETTDGWRLKDDIRVNIAARLHITGCSPLTTNITNGSGVTLSVSVAGGNPVWERVTWIATDTANSSLLDTYAVASNVTNGNVTTYTLAVPPQAFAAVTVGLPMTLKFDVYVSDDNRRQLSFQVQRAVEEVAGGSLTLPTTTKPGDYMQNTTTPSSETDGSTNIGIVSTFVIAVVALSILAVVHQVKPDCWLSKNVVQPVVDKARALRSGNSTEPDIMIRERGGHVSLQRTPPDDSKGGGQCTSLHTTPQELRAEADLTFHIAELTGSPQRAKPPLGDGRRVSLSIPGPAEEDPDVISYGVKVFVYDTASKDYRLFHEKDGLSYRDFPYEVQRGVKRGYHYTCSVWAAFDSTFDLIRTVKETTASFSPADDLPVLISWPSELGVPVKNTGSGTSCAVVRLPQLSPDMASRYPSFEIEYRERMRGWIGVDNEISSKPTALISSCLPPGAYDVRVRGTDRSGQTTAWTLPLRFYTVGRELADYPEGSATGDIPASVNVADYPLLLRKYLCDVLGGKWKDFFGVPDVRKYITHDAWARITSSHGDSGVCLNYAFTAMLAEAKMIGRPITVGRIKTWLDNPDLDPGKQLWEKWMYNITAGYKVMKDSADHRQYKPSSEPSSEPLQPLQSAQPPLSSQPVMPVGECSAKVCEAMGPCVTSTGRVCQTLPPAAKATSSSGAAAVPVTAIAGQAAAVAAVASPPPPPLRSEASAPPPAAAPPPPPPPLRSEASAAVVAPPKRPLRSAALAAAAAAAPKPPPRSKAYICKGHKRHHELDSEPQREEGIEGSANNTTLSHSPPGALAMPRYSERQQKFKHRKVALA